MRIGLIDDEPIVLELLDGFLRELGHHVTSADSGERFLAGASRGDLEFDLILTDFTMPGISGTSLIRELRHRFPEASLIVMSGFTETLSPDWVRVKWVRVKTLHMTYRGRNKWVRVKTLHMTYRGSGVVG